MKVYTAVPHDKIVSATEKLFNYVRHTYGPAGLGVLIDRGRSQEILDDGFAAIEEFELEDELENAVIGYIKEASRKTNKRAGDGTTTSVLIMTSIVREAMKTKKESLTRTNMNILAHELRVASEGVVKQIRKDAKRINTKDDLERIALNSYNNPDMAKVVADMILAVGADGAIALEESETLETTTELVAGMKIDRGYTSPYMAGAEGQDFEAKNPLILLTDEKILGVDILIPILDPHLKAGRKDFLIVCEELGGEALATVLINKLKGMLNLVCVKCPGYGESKHQAMEDIAVLTGATYISETRGRSIKSVVSSDLGGAKRVVVSSSETLVVGGKGKKEDIEARAKTIRPLLDTGSTYDKQYAQERLASLTGGIGVIRVGAPTEGEMRSIKSKTEDAISATKLAFKEGVIAGGGVTLAGFKTSSDILNTALKEPRKVLEENGGDAISADAQDSAGVTIASLESAVSVAANLITTGAIITDKREEKE